MSHAPTEQQEAIFADVANGDTNLAITARAGCGKTETAAAAAGLLPDGTRVAATSFNRSIVDELSRRFGAYGASARTLHSVGKRTLDASFRDATLDKEKYRKILFEIRPDWFRRTLPGKPLKPDPPAHAALTLAEKCRLTLSDHERAEDLLGLISRYDILITSGFTPEVCATASDLVRIGLVETETYDFADMLFLPVRLGLRLPRVDFLFIDEAQDLNPCQQALALRLVKPPGRVCVIGDDRQSIYGFNGADPVALTRLMSDLGERANGCTHHKLSVSFRCPISHVLLARHIVPDLEYHFDAPEGYVASINHDELPHFLRPGCLVICRRNAPLIDLAHDLQKQGVTVRLGKGKSDQDSEGSYLYSLLESLQPSSVKDLLKKIERRASLVQEDLASEKVAASQGAARLDRLESLAKLAHQSATLDELRRQLQMLFFDPDPTDCRFPRLCTVHAAKGLEADRVIILEPETLPLRFPNLKPWEIEQEHNIVYVALTRSRKSLFFCGELSSLLSEARTNAGKTLEDI